MNTKILYPTQSGFLKKNKKKVNSHVAGKLTHGSFAQLPQNIVCLSESEEINELWAEIQKHRQEREHDLRKRKKYFCGMSESKMKAEAEGEE